MPEVWGDWGGCWANEENGCRAALYRSEELCRDRQLMCFLVVVLACNKVQGLLRSISRILDPFLLKRS